MQERLFDIQTSLPALYPEIILALGILILVFFSFFKKIPGAVPLTFSIIILAVSVFLISGQSGTSEVLFSGMLQKENFSSTLKILIDISAALTCVMWMSRKNALKTSELCAFIFTIVLGGHLLVMSNNLLMVFLSIELISISSYILAGYGANKQASEGSLKYFLFGSVASAIMLYGFSILYGLTGTLDFTSEDFARHIIEGLSPLMMIAGLMALAGFLFKISAAPMHLWSPDVYESAPIPIIAFFSVAPKLAGLGILAKFILAMNAYGQSPVDWQWIVVVFAILTLTVGNFAALAQQNAKRLMAYSSIAQSGFLMIGIAAFLPQGLLFMIFYATVYMMMNYAVFIFLQYFEDRGVVQIRDFSGLGKAFLLPSLLLLTALIALTGLPPTSGFTAKLFIFSALWESYALSGKPALLLLLVFGLINTVISLFFYLKIPYYAFLKPGQTAGNQNFLTPQNLLGVILVLLIVTLFFIPELLMGWINKVNFVF